MAQHGNITPYEIPKSRGVPPVVRWFFMVGVVIIVFMGFISINKAGENHAWPADSTPTETLHGSLTTH
jgi:hypothetical protein